MLAALYHGPHDLRVEQVPVPTIGPGELLIRVQAAGICGTDLRIWHGGHRKFPPGTQRIPGHEVAGTIAEVGAGLQGFSAGQAVFVAPNMGCGHCLQCITGHNNRCADYEAIGVTLDGAFAEYVRIPAQSVQQGNIIPLDAGVDPAAAALIEPFACVLRGQDALHIQPGEVVLVMGAGPIGMMHVKLARLRGAGRVLLSEPAADRRLQAAHMGVDRVIDPAVEDLAAVVAAESHGRGADAILVAAPAHQAQESALQAAAIGGRINFFGALPKDRPTIPFDSNLVHYKEMIVTGTTACSTSDCRRAAEIVNSGRVDLSDLISQRFPLAQTAAAFTAAEDRKFFKVVLEP
jgi:L-iditol 2-dehydrogenase